MRYLLLLLLLFNPAYAQQLLPVDCNTLFICVDSGTYNSLFSNKYIKDTLCICRESATTTNEEGYTGKYMIGKAATLEWFAPNKNGKFGDHYGDIGIELKTRQIGQLAALHRKARTTHTAVDTTTTFIADSAGNIPWYSTLTTYGQPTNLQLTNIEYVKEYLEYLGFSQAEISSPMDYATFNNHLSQGKPYPRQFSHIASVTISITSKHLDQIRPFFALNNFKENDHFFSNAQFAVKYLIDEHVDKVEVQQIDLILLSDQGRRIISLPHIKVSINGKQATFKFY